MRKIFILFFTILPFILNAENRSLNDFETLMDALKSGETVSAVFHYGSCELISDNEVKNYSIDAIGGMKIDTWEYFAKGSIRNKEAFVVASTAKLIANPLDDGFVHNYVKIKVSESGKVKITAKYLDARTFEETMSENFFTTISDGENGAAHFFSKI